MKQCLVTMPQQMWVSEKLNRLSPICTQLERNKEQQSIQTICVNKRPFSDLSKACFRHGLQNTVLSNPQQPWFTPIAHSISATFYRFRVSCKTPHFITICFNWWKQNSMHIGYSFSSSLIVCNNCVSPIFTQQHTGHQLDVRGPLRPNDSAPHNQWPNKPRFIYHPSSIHTFKQAMVTNFKVQCLSFEISSHNLLGFLPFCI